MKIKYIWYRIRQFGFSAFMYLAPLRQAKVIRGAGSIYQIPKMLKKDKKKKVLIVTTPGFIRRGSAVGRSTCGSTACIASARIAAAG